MQIFTTLLTETKKNKRNGEKKSRRIKPFFSIEIRKQWAVEANIQANHVFTARAQKRVNTEIEQKRRSPIIEGWEEASFLCWDSRNEIVGIFVMFGINAVVTNHFEVFMLNILEKSNKSKIYWFFKMFSGDVNDESFDEINSVNGFRNQLVIFMPVVVKSNGLPVIIVDTGRSDISTSRKNLMFRVRNLDFSSLYLGLPTYLPIYLITSLLLAIDGLAWI